MIVSHKSSTFPVRNTHTVRLILNPQHISRIPLNHFGLVVALSLWFGWPYHHLRPDPLRELLLRIIIQPLRPARLYERRAFFVRLLRDLGRLQEGKGREVCVREQW